MRQPEAIHEEDYCVSINSKFFRDLMRDKDISVRKLAADLGMNHHSQLSLMLAGKRRMQLDEAVALGKLLGVPLNMIIANAGFPEIMRAGKRLPVVGILRGNGEIEKVPANTERAVAPAEEPTVVSAIQARTTDTALTWMDRWVFYCTEKQKPNPALLGQFCHIQLKGGKQVVAQLRRGYDEKSYRLTGTYNAENVAVDWVAPIVLTRT